MNMSHFRALPILSGSINIIFTSDIYTYMALKLGLLKHFMRKRVHSDKLNMALLLVTSSHFYSSIMVQQVIYDTLFKKKKISRTSLIKILCSSNKTASFCLFTCLRQPELPVTHHMKRAEICGKPWRISCLWRFLCTSNTSAVQASVL